MIRRYYENELHYLQQVGDEFAKAHPEQAPYLNLESANKGDRDPYVERLLEGFAFLCGRIHERLDDELPELTEALFNLLWPHYLKPLPALSILEFKPKPGLVQKTEFLKAGTEVCSGPIGSQGVDCRFRTTQEVRLQPLTLEEAALTWPPDGKTNLKLRFKLERGIEYPKLQLNPLRLYFNADDTIASMMHLFFTRHVDRMKINVGGVEETLAGAKAVKPVGFAANEGLVEYSPHSFSGLRFVQEYLGFRRKFWFVDLCGFEAIANPPPKTAEFEVQIFFNRSYPDEKKFAKDHLRLFCAPVVNLFKLDAEPIRVDHLSAEYQVVPNVQYRQSLEVYEIDADSVIGTVENTGEQLKYSPFFSFRHGENGTGRYFTAVTRLGPSEQITAQIKTEREPKKTEAVVVPGGFKTGEGNLPAETLSMKLVCTNGNLPRELPLKSINQPVAGFSNLAVFENLTVPTLALNPPVAAMRSSLAQKNFLWKLLSHLALNSMSVVSLEGLKGLLELYDWTINTDANKQRIAGIKNLTWAPKEDIRRGAIVRGTEVTIELESNSFTDEGDICLFGKMLSEFFSMYATINSFVHLTIIEKPAEKRHEWKPAKGMLPVV